MFTCAYRDETVHINIHTDLGLDVGETPSCDDRDKNLRHVRKSLKHLNMEFPFDPLKSNRGTSLVAGGRTVRSGWAPCGARVPS